MVVFICWRILKVGEILNLLVSLWANFLQVCLQRCLFPSPGIPDHQLRTAVSPSLRHFEQPHAAQLRSALIQPHVAARCI